MINLNASFFCRVTILAVLTSGTNVDAFKAALTTPQRITRVERIRLFNSGSDYDNVEKAREQLLRAWDEEGNRDTAINNNNQLSAKKLIRLVTDSDVSDFHKVLPSPPPLTTAERDRRLAELKLLEQLASSDEANEDLMKLWESERGKDGQERLEHAAGMLDAGQVIAAENMLLKLIDDYGLFFIEPINRLATVYFRQGKFQESYQLYACVLHLKPWHVGALEGIVTVCMRLCDRGKARSYAEKSLPRLIANSSFPPFATTGPANPKRAEWVHGAIQEAQEALSHLEYQTQRDFLGSPEEYYLPKMSDRDKDESNQIIFDDEKGAWQ